MGLRGTKKLRQLILFISIILYHAFNLSIHFVDTGLQVAPMPSAIGQVLLKRVHSGSRIYVTTGNFIAILGDLNSEKLAQSFCNQCKLTSIDLPYASLQIPLTFEDITKFGLFDILRSDHAPFWREGIPALMLTDTANFRYPFYHTQADTIDKLDFDFMTKICKATIATAIEYVH